MKSNCGARSSCRKASRIGSRANRGGMVAVPCATGRHRASVTETFPSGAQANHMKSPAAHLVSTALIAVSMVATAQTVVVSGVVRGVVTDRSGAVVHGAMVALTLPGGAQRLE